MKSINKFLITLLISLSTVFAIYPKLVFAYSKGLDLSSGNGCFPVMFTVAFVTCCVLAFIVYIIGEIVNRK